MPFFKKNTLNSFFSLSLIIFVCAFVIYRSFFVSLPRAGEPIQFYSNQCGQDLYWVMVQSIRQARESIYLSIFGLSDLGIVQALGKAIQQKKPVTIYCDPTASISAQEQLHGGKVVPVEQGGLMHQKILVLDQEKVFIGSANMTPSSLSVHDNLVVGFSSPAIAQFLLQNMPYRSGYFSSMVAGQFVELWLLPDVRGQALQALEKQINQATRSVYTALFTLTHPHLVEALLAAHRRGVQVKVVLDRQSAFGASAQALQRLRAKGVCVSLSQGAQLMHHKFAWIDEKYLVVGSANWTKSAFAKNSDVLMLIHHLTQDQKQFMHQLWRRIEGQAE